MIMIHISVIIPTYKPQAYLWECLDSMVAQTFPKEEFEVILVLNGCSEPWKSEIEDYITRKMQGMHIQFLHTEQGGVSNARNMGLDAAQGAYIAFVDDDDYVSPAYLEELYAKATVDTVPVCYPLSFLDGTKVYEPFYITGDFLRHAHRGKCDFKKVRKFFSGPVYKLLHRTVIGNRRFDLRFKNGEDSLFMFLISDRFHYVDFTSREAVYYRRYRSNSASMRSRSCWNIIENQLRMMIAYTCIFFRSPSRYSFQFYATRLMGALHSMKELFKPQRRVMEKSERAIPLIPNTGG